MTPATPRDGILHSVSQSADQTDDQTDSQLQSVTTIPRWKSNLAGIATRFGRWSSSASMMPLWVTDFPTVDSLMAFVTQEIESLGACIEQACTDAENSNPADPAKIIEDRLAMLCAKFSMLNAILIQSVPTARTGTNDNQVRA